MRRTIILRAIRIGYPIILSLLQGQWEKDDAFVERIRIGGLFHDIGKIGVQMLF